MTCTVPKIFSLNNRSSCNEQKTIYLFATCFSSVYSLTSCGIESQSLNIPFNDVLNNVYSEICLFSETYLFFPLREVSVIYRCLSSQVSLYFLLYDVNRKLSTLWGANSVGPNGIPDDFIYKLRYIIFFSL